MEQLNTVPNKGRFDRISDAINHNFLLLNNDLEEVRLATAKSKGMFSTADALTSKYPKPLDGDWAFVGAGFPCQVYTAANGVWSQTGTYSGDNVSLNDYVLKTDHDDDIDALEEEIQEIKDEIYGESHETDELTFTAENQTKAVQSNGVASTIPSGAIVYLEGDISSLKGHAGSTPSSYQTLTSGTMTDRVINYVTCSSVTGDVTITWKKPVGIVNDVSQVKEATSDFENKLRGVGNNASANKYPILHLGDVSDINGVNELLQTAFSSTDVKYQGRLRLTRNGQVIYVEQYGINYPAAKWAQVVYGMVSPSQGEVELVQAFDHPHIVWRMADVDVDSTTEKPKWHDMSDSISLKTINGNSLLGEGNITIGESEQITVDGTLDGTSDNAVSNKVVKTQVYDVLAEAIQQVMGEKDVKTIDNWGTVPSTADKDVYAYDSTSKQLYHRENGHWNQVELSKHALYIKASDNTEWRWTGTDMEKIGGGSFPTVSQTVTDGDVNPVSGEAVFEAIRAAQGSQSAYPSREILPFDDIITSTVTLQESGYSGDGGTVVFSTVQGRFLLRVGLLSYQYYATWNANGSRRASTDYNDANSVPQTPFLGQLYAIHDTNVYKWNGTSLVPVGNSELDTEINATTGAHETKAPSTKAVYEALSTVQGGVTTNADNITTLGGRVTSLESIASSAASSKDYNDERLYPEYYLTAEEKENLRYCPNYYDWNTVRYNSDIETPEAQYIQDGANAEVLFPTEHVRDSLSYVQGLVNTSTTPYKLLPQDVYYDTANARFLLKIGDNYYTEWINSSLWQNSQGLREDTVYAAITPGAAVENVSGYYLINQWIVKNGVKTPLIVDGDLNTATNFRDAILSCLTANNGNMKLHGDRIYGVTGSTIENSRNDFTIDGQGATICYIPRRKKSPQQNAGENEAVSGSVLYVQNKSNFTIKNICIKGVRTAVRNVASGYPFSHSSSNMYGISCLQCKDYLLKNVEFSGMCYDMGITASGNNTSDRVVIDGWKSKASEGIWISTTPTLLIINADVTMAPYSSKHTIYCGESRYVKNHVIKNSRFVQNTKYNSNFLQYKTVDGASTSMENDNQAKINNLTFENCYIKTGRGTVINPTMNPFNFTFEHCTILQHHDLAADGGIGYWGSGSVSSTKSASHGILQSNNWCNLAIRNCRIMAWSMPIYIHNNGDTGYATNSYIPNPIVDIEDTVITMLDLPNYSNYVQNDDINQIMLFNTGTDFSPKVLTRIFKNIVTNAIGMYPTDNGSSRPEVDGVIFSDALPVGFSYYNTTLEKTLSIKSHLEDGRRLWKDENDNTYLNDNTPVEGGTPIYRGLAANRPKGAPVGDVYYATDTNKAYRCVNRGAQSRMCYTVSRVLSDEEPIPVNGNLKIYIGVTSGTAATMSTEALKKYLLVDVDLAQDVASESNTALRDWLISRINAKYRDFTCYYQNGVSYEGVVYYDKVERKKAWANSTGNIFSISTDYGFSMYENAEVPISLTNDGYAKNVGGWYYLFDGVGMTIERYQSAPMKEQPSGSGTWVANQQTSRFADVTHKAVAAEIAAATHISQYDAIYQHLAEQTRYENPDSDTIPKKTLSPNRMNYYTFGFDAIWQEINPSEISGGDIGIAARVTELESTKNTIPYISLWDDDYQNKEDWGEGDYWYAPTEGELKIFKNQDFEKVVEYCIIAYQESSTYKLYMWWGDTLQEITLGNQS